MDLEARATRNGVSANHLLNFSLPERDKHVYSHHQKKKSAPPRTQSEYLHAKYVVALFLARSLELPVVLNICDLNSFRFVISPLDPDTVVPTWDLEALTEWSSVEQVLLWYDDNNPQTCPICMDAFRAPKITKCGHIFCWPCILRYLSLTDKYWRRCPMCFESVQKGHLRSVQLQQLQLPPHADSNVTFQFLERPKSSMFPQLRVLPPVEDQRHLAADSSSLMSALPSPEAAAFAERKRSRKLPSVNDADATYSRILESTPEYLRELLYSEMRGLQSMDAEFRSSGDVENLPFVEEAMRNTSGRLAKSEDAGQGTHGTHHYINGAGSANGKATPSHDVAGHGNGEVYSFYQIANGTYVILHPLNLKCLLKEFDQHQHVQSHGESEDTHHKELEAAWTEETSSSASSEPLPVDRYHLLPEQIRGRVLDVEHVVMDDEVQKRYRFLSHLPRFCDFYVCELDLTDQLSPATLASFRSELKKRDKQRKHKHKLQNAVTPSSPIFKSSSMAFSLEQEGMSWPAPAELSVAEAFDDFNLSGVEHREVYSEEHEALASVSSYPLNDESSFARVTENSGYFPALGAGTGETSVHAARAQRSDPFGSPSAWGSASSPPGGDWDLRKTGKKKGSGKKGVPLFSTSQRRSYR
ncbi:hypothetical protein BBJ28_00008250 [Nothophytophthora sp. Chile5]|nr:hypothetical protein BBJ28_00008250 [Nothophytophthora sp. Chile5]